MINMLFSNQSIIIKAVIKGFVGLATLVGLYFVIVSLISGWSFAFNQFNTFWYFFLGLSAGFGVQIGLYSYLKSAIRYQNQSGKVVAVSGAISAVAMVSCCAHYLVNLLPIIGISGVFILIGQYQIELFWLGLAANLFGIIYIASRLIKFSKQ